MRPPLNIHGDNEVEKEEMEKDEEKESEREEDENIDEESDDEEEEEEEMMMLLLNAACAVVVAVVSAVRAIMTVEHIEGIEPLLVHQPVLTSGYDCKHNVDELAKLRPSIGEISQSLEAMRGRMERNCRLCWDIVKEMDMDDVTRFQVMELLKGKKTRDMFLDMTVQERKGWIEYKLGSNQSSC